MPSDGSRGELSLPQKRIVDGFDKAAKELAASTISRRRALKLAGSALLGGGLMALFPGVGSAQVSVQGACADRPAINNKRCPLLDNCADDSECFCARTVSGNKRCVRILGAGCPETDECDSNSDCPSGEICIKIRGCCPESPRFNACRPVCR